MKFPLGVSIRNDTVSLEPILPRNNGRDYIGDSSSLIIEKALAFW